MSQEFEKKIFEIGSELLKESKNQDQLFFKKNWWYQKILSWTMKNQKLKTSLFRFIDVLPNLSNDKQFLSHWKEYFKDQDLSFITSGLSHLVPSLMVQTLRKQITQVAQMFITGSNVETALKVISQNWEKGLAFSFDILEEETLSEKEAEIYFQSYLSVMNQLKVAQKNWSYKKTLQQDSSGDIPKVNISVKISALFSQIKVSAWEYSKIQIKNRLRLLFRKAVQDFSFINLDMEYYHYKDLYLEIFKELLMEEEFKNYPHFGIVVQAYLKDSLKDLQELIHFCKMRKQKITIRLVKGAYWDSEYLLARRENWLIPVFTQKVETDINFEKALVLLFKECEHVKIAVGSHNIRSIAYALTLYEKYPQAQIEFQLLYGMAEGLTASLSQRGFLTRLYCTVGELIPGMSYLVRRLLENSSNQSFILNSLMKKESPEKLLSAPCLKESSKRRVKPTEKLQYEGFEKALSFQTKGYFSNFPVPDFSKKQNRDSFRKSLKEWKIQFPLEVPILLGSKRLKSSEIFKRENPNQTEQMISNTFFADKDIVSKAVEKCHNFFPKWKTSPTSQRVTCLQKVAQIMKKNFFNLASLQVYEVGKTWEEACGDVAEAIDFCSYYALSYERLATPQLTDEVSGEESFLSYEAIGCVAVIAPWNFPLAILTGMTVAPLVCGNTVLIKPAEQSSLTAYEFVKILLKAGFPSESFAFLPGKGEEVGKALVEHPKISIISFTGSFEVGEQIMKKAGSILQGQENIKRCVLEMGGKNAIVVDSSADLDLAIKGILQSSFVFQGQKCSACSRIVILEDIYDRFMKRFIPALESLIIGSSENPETTLGSVVDRKAYERIQNFIKRQEKFSENNNKSSLKQRLLYKDIDKDFIKKSYFISPVLYLTSDRDSELMQKELFAPIVACFKVKTLKEAIQIVNHSSFGLTAGIYSRHPRHIEEFQSFVSVGNLYVNRTCTGAIVKRHPFGGRKMSGLGSKAGSVDYLKQFMQVKVVTENNVRRGFSPELFEQ
ncbi:MAG: bifunctional proline dehydrogenase/L-glutamate gamma-semialdehyde dehydrogenase [Bdellovibrionales bacterium]|nr:bifunctional proline dehydrogenase/L-glutamate gamma-semialdehyde dehydrogenase [Bdellovibrionales bacterium]